MTESTAGLRRPVALSVLLGLFVLSGAAGLVYQSVWSQYLGLVLGHAAYAQSLVLAIFMGGMSLGAWLSARVVERLANPILAYALIEGVIGVFGLGFHALFVSSSGFLYGTVIPGVESQLAVDALRWTYAAVLILPQTILLGMTFPIMSVGLARWSPDMSGRVLGGLYFFNSIGAAAGALVATFVLVPTSGLPGAMLVAGAANLLITAVLVGAKLPPRPPIVATSPRDTDSATGAGSLYRFVLVAALITGASSFMYEIGWVRMLSLALGASIHAFELMLAAFIGGLALGGLWTRKRLDATADPLKLLGYVQILMGLCALATLPLYDRSFHWMGWLMGSLARSDSGYVLFNIASASIAMLIMTPAAFFAGMTLPIMTYVLLRRGAGERAVGHVYAANTFGAILGVIAATHLAIPLAGLKFSMVGAALVDIGLGLAVLLWYVPASARRLALVGSATAALVALVIVAAPFDPRRLASGVYRTGNPRLVEQSRIRFYEDGKTASVAIYGDDRALTIATNGKPDAALGIGEGFTPTGDEPTMILAGLLGPMFHPGAKTAGVVGFGSGLTTHTLAAHPGFRRIDTVEIEPQMVEAARHFGDRVRLAYEDPRSKVIIDDARAYFSSRRARYDIIVSEPSNPWVSGVAKLFSQEFYRFAKSHLADGGLMIQWIQAYEIDDLTFLTILRAIDEEFTDYRLYLASAPDILIVATPKGRLPDPSDGSLAAPAVVELAGIAGVRSLADLHERVLADRDLARAMITTRAANPNSDFFPIVAHAAPKDRFKGLGARLTLTLPNSTMGAYTLLGLIEPAREGVVREPRVYNPVVDRRRQAWLLAGALQGKPVSALPSDGSVLALHALLQSHAPTCLRSLPPQSAIETLLEAFALTTASLPVSEARKVWVDRAWLSPCSAEPASEVARLLAAFADAFHPDAVRALDSARAGLASASAGSAEWFAYAQLALVGAIRGGDIAALDETMSVAVAAPLQAAHRHELFTLANYGRIRLATDSAGHGRSP